MARNARLSGCLDEMTLEFVEREATPKLLMRLSIQLHLFGLSLSNTVYFLKYSVLIGFDRLFITGFTRPIYSRNLVGDHITVRSTKTVIQLDDVQYWLYATVDPNLNDLLHTKLDPTRTNVIADSFSQNSDKHDVDDAIFLVDGAVLPHRACEKHDIKFRYDRHGNRNSVERVFHEVKRRNTSFTDCFSNAKAETANE